MAAGMFTPSPVFTSWLAQQPRIVLGSASSSRKTIMSDLLGKHPYLVRTADIDEKAIRRPDPRELVMTLAHAKAEAIRAKMRDAGEDVSQGYLITCDQVVVHEGIILEKPESLDEARSFIQGYGRAPCATVGSILCTNFSTGQTFECVDEARIHFTPFPEAIIAQILAQGECMYCAGGLKIEDPLVVPQVICIEGTEDTVMGMSKLLVMQLLLQAAGLQTDPAIGQLLQPRS
eukprot:CAMPEP_0119107900 /NCGR_PEP_ID=MMETSP1180-20130426/12269_1 /TAXON_ID=3052 ORGANISM="Chlamydomonas cf sp, Strain CCMP681" /NCGR_SAMPLE_ID=MMETSP1180 /ASSEMBLY_ACC=CAM_ASM_000741 /LENGTH=231 /DNA_ID=CAMNT_0007093449 /DNA_START=97 /DNA_END=792 /DNA_ORIENTATION=-